MFAKSDLLLVNKIDLLAHVDFNFHQLEHAIKTIKPRLPIYRISTKTGEGLEQWLSWLGSRLRRKTGNTKSVLSS